jgi:phosphate transport system protein
MRRHTDASYEGELDGLRRQLWQMCSKVCDAVDAAIRAFERGNTELARRVIHGDREIDQLETSIDEMALRILARRQPVASDLRFIAATLKLVTDLERIGDLGSNIAERVVESTEYSLAQQKATVLRMADAALGMVRDALDAYDTRDVGKAEQVLERDDVVDAYYAGLFAEIVAKLRAEPQTADEATRLQSISRHLERIADHATNIAEMVVFMVRGDDVRHTGKPFEHRA